jgi:pyruvate/2-oxoglutarate dehydrogenase complex dihydrolipoamide dehydrogenase (E3) component
LLVKKLYGNTRKVEYFVLANAVFTIPHLVSVGFNEEQAKSEGLDFECIRDAAQECLHRSVLVRTMLVVKYGSVIQATRLLASILLDITRVRLPTYWA